ncbi:unnamed protein product, partial [Didymodactylos carnosus]
LLLCKGFTHTLDKTSDDKTYWKCEHAQTLKCKGRAHTNYINTIMLYETDNHNHPESAVSSAIRIFEEKIRRAVHCNETTQSIIDNRLTNLSDAAVARLLWNPKSIMMDFERAAINAFGGSFTTTTNPSTMSGCFFHLQNNIQHKVQELGLKTNYEQDPVFAHNVSIIAAHAFLQPADVSQGFDDLHNSSPPMLHPLLDYFEDTYIGRQRSQGRSKPMFSVEFWNMHQRTTDLSMRTNNSAEA